jgi:hypothetical protein
MSRAALPCLALALATMAGAVTVAPGALAQTAHPTAVRAVTAAGATGGSGGSGPARAGVPAAAARAGEPPAAAAASADDARRSAIFEAAKALGASRATSDATAVRSGSSEAVLADRVVGYTATPPEADLYATKNVTGKTAEVNSACAAAPNDPRCAGVKAGTTLRPPHGLTPASPVLAGQAAARRPTSVLGAVASMYEACTESGGQMTSPATFERRTCSLTTEAWRREPCTKTLTVRPVETYTCTEGEVLASATMGSGEASTVVARCPAGGGLRIPFTFDARGSRGSCSGAITAVLDLSTPSVPGAPPTYAGTLQPHWFGGCFPMEVYWSTTGCTSGRCGVRIDVVQSPGVVPVYTCSAPGTTLGSQISWYMEAPPYNAGTTCYAPFVDWDAAGGRPGGPGNHGGVDAWWGEMAAAEVTGWAFGEGLRQGATLNLAMRATPATGDQWANTCESQEARTPLLAQDGVTVPISTVMPVQGAPGQAQCVRTRSVCTDGPSTRTIGGVPVTRECWEYSNEFVCTQVAAGSSCSDSMLRSCNPAGATGCTEFDAAGRCINASLAFDCKTADAVFTDVVRCGDSTYCADGSCWAQERRDNDQFAMAVSQLEAHLQAGKDIDSTGAEVEIFKGQDRRCRISLFSIDNCCTDRSLIERCTTEEQATYDLKVQGRCQEIGEYCSNRSAFGICVEKTRSSCCFSSLLARVVQQQGRAQLSQGWGDARTPDCAGFSPEELAGLDWSRMDLSEFYASINPTPLDSGAVSGSATGRQPSCYYGQGRC